MLVDGLPEYHVEARNTSASSENAIHHDDVARRHGFPGALVPGVTIYAYLTEPLVAAFGAGWLDRGTATVRFRKPILHGEPVIVAGSVTPRDGGGASMALAARTDRTGECAELTAALPAGRPTPVNLAFYRRQPLPEARPEATREHLGGLDALGTPVVRYDEAQAAEYLEAVADPLPIYRGPEGRVHPSFYLRLANRALDRNVRMSAWIHVSSVIRHLAPARVGDSLAALARVRSLFAKHGREFVELDIVVTADERRPVAHVLHTAIYRLPAP